MKYRNYYCTPKYSEGDRSYYGDVSGVPEIPLIEAKTLDDFERLFHKAVDDYIDDLQTETHRTRWGLIVSILATVCVFIVMALTCPKKEQHVEVLSDRFSSILSEHMGQDDDLSVLGTIVGSKLAKGFIDLYVTVDDYVLFSVGHIRYDGEDRIASIGAMGHIFTASKEQIKRRVEQDPDIQEFFNGF